MKRLRTYAILGVIVSLAVTLSLLRDGPLFQGAQSVYHEAGGDDAPSPFLARRSLRSWSADTSEWQEGAAQVLGSHKGDLPADSLIGRSASAVRSEVASAVAIGEGGEQNLMWLTARHAVDGCVSIRIAAGEPGRSQPLLSARPRALHPTVDLALLETGKRDGARSVIPVEPAILVGREAIHIGFPGGRPAAIYSFYLGMTRVRWIDNSLPIEAYRVWAEHAQLPVALGRLGGLSGGATVNRQGNLVGTVVGVSERRGRILSTQRAHIAILFRADEPLTTASASAAVFDEVSYPVFARHLVEERRVARLNCER